MAQHASSSSMSAFRWLSVLKSRGLAAAMLVGLIMLLAWLLACDDGVLVQRLDASELTRSYQKSSKRAFDFDKKGVQAGQPMPQLKVVDLQDGKTYALSDAWKDKPALIVTCSLTCPVSRRQSRQVEKMAQFYAKNLVVVYLYTLEAHPQTDPSPYRGREWITSQNKREKILYRQPRTLAERVKLAGLFKKRVHATQPIVLDNLKNTAWQALGAGPNVGILVDTHGKVVARHGWFNARSMAHSIETLLKNLKEK